MSHSSSVLFSIVKPVSCARCRLMGLYAPVHRRHCHGMPKSSHVIGEVVDADAAQAEGQEGRNDNKNARQADTLTVRFLSYL